MLCAAVHTLAAQQATVRGTVNVIHKEAKTGDSGDAVIWLTPVRGTPDAAPGKKVRLVQKNKRFTPHLLAVTQGTQIDFPNEDPFFHNVFSIYRGKPFDLGLYESGTTKALHFSQPGVYYIFCNIHPEMSAVVLVFKTTYFTASAKDGNFLIANIPPGRYKMEVWHERASSEELSGLAKEIEIASGENKVGVFTIHASDAPTEHLNKYGEPYAKPGKTKY